MTNKDKKVLAVNFIGSSFDALSTLCANPKFNLKKVYCLSSKHNVNQEHICKAFNLDYILFDDKKELIANFQKCKNPLISIVYQLDMIIPKELVENYKFYNIHRGSVEYNRGPTPDVWSILSDDKYTATSLHIMNEKIDAGELIDQLTFPITNHMSLGICRELHSKNIPILIESIYQHELSDKTGSEIKTGRENYRNWVKESDITIDLSIDTVNSIDKKILSQSVYNGAIIYLEERKIFVNKHLLICDNQEPPNDRLSEIIYESETHVIIKWKDKISLFSVNTNEIKKLNSRKNPNPKLI